METQEHPGIKRIIISGGTGLIGSRLRELLKKSGYDIILLTRSPDTGDLQRRHWDPDRGELDTADLEGVHGIIHLAGANIAERRWNEKRKRALRESRTRSTRLIVQAMSGLRSKPSVFVSSSAIGYYGDRGDTLLDEESPPGAGFLPELTLQWEAEARKATGAGIRTVLVRTGMVLSLDGGGLPRMLLPVRMGMGSPLGSGTQYISWIHLDDICGIYKRALEDSSLSGPVNAVAPHPVTNGEMTGTIAKTWKRPLLLPSVPAFALKMVLGEMSHLVLDSARVSSRRIEEHGYAFHYRDLGGALESLRQNDRERQKMR